MQSSPRSAAIVCLLVLLAGCPNRRPPEPPPPAGTADGVVHQTYIFLVPAYDPDGDSVVVVIDWGDENADTSGLICSGDTAVMSHSWTLPDTYAIRAELHDERGSESGWSREHLVAITAPPGTVLWSLDGCGWWRNAPAIGHDGTIYVGSRDGALRAVSPDGPIKWSRDLGAGLTSPAIGEDGTIFVAVGVWLFALRPDGTQRWAYQTGGAIFCSPALGADGTLYFGSSDGWFYALRSDGSLRWRRDACLTTWPAAIGPDGTIYVCCDDDSVVALDPLGETKWQYSVACEMSSGPALGTSGDVYLAADIPGDHGSYIYVLDQGGSLKWFHGVPHDNINDSPAIGADGTVYYGTWPCDDTRGGNVNAVNPDGSLKWTIATEEVFCSPALLSDGTICFGADPGPLYAFGLAGAARWQSPVGAWSAPAVGGGVIYVVDFQGTLNAVSTGGRLADAPWPMYMHDAQHTSRAR